MPMPLPQFKLERIKLTLIILLPFILLFPRILFLRDNALLACTMVLGLVAILALVWKRSYVDLAVPVIILAALWFARAATPVRTANDLTLIIRVAGVMAFLFLNFTLLIGPWSRIHKFFIRFYKHRRHLGVTTLLLALTHASTISAYFFADNPEKLLAAEFVLFGSTALLILFALGATSWNYLQKHVSVKVWQIVHLALLVAYLSEVFYFYFLPRSQPVSSWIKYIIGGFVIYWIAISPYALPRLIQFVTNGWKQLHTLIWIAYVAVIIHIWTGTASFQAAWVQAAFWVVVGTVAISHLIGWMIRLREVLSRRPAKAVMIDGKEYYLLDSIDSFTPDVGRKFVINNVPLAVFLHKGKIIAYSNVCPHQNGPLYQGKIVNGYLECPWHQWQYSVKDGCGPPGHADCVPFYDVRLEGRIAYVNLSLQKPK